MTSQDELSRSIAGLVQLSRQFGVNLDDDIARLQVEINALNITQQQLEVHRQNIQSMMETIQRKVATRIDDLQVQVDKQRQLKETFEKVYGETEIPDVPDVSPAQPETPQDLAELPETPGETEAEPEATETEED